MTYTVRKTVVFLFLICVASFSHAGLLSSLVKAAKKADAPDVNLSRLDDFELSLNKLNIPEGRVDEVLTAKLDANGNWRFTNAYDNSFDRLDAFDNPIIFLDKVSVPRDLSKLDALPMGASIYVRSGSSFLELSRSNGWVLKAGQAGIRVKDYDTFQKGVWHFQSAWSPSRVRVVGASEPSTASTFGPSGISVKNVLNSGSELRGATLVFTGDIHGSAVRVGGQDFDISALREQAQKYDMSIVVVEKTGSSNPQQLLKEIQAITPEAGVATTGDFLSHFGRADNANYYSISETGKNQVLISREIEKVTDGVTNREIRIEDELVSLTAHLGIRVFKPSEERQTELDARWVYWLPTWAGVYLVFSAMAGFLAFGSSRDFLRRLWPVKPRKGYRNAVYFLFMKMVRASLLVVVILPLLGLPILIGRILITTYYICYGILILCYRLIKKISKPFVFIYREIMGRKK